MTFDAIIAFPPFVVVSFQNKFSHKSVLLYFGLVAIMSADKHFFVVRTTGEINANYSTM